MSALYDEDFISILWHVSRHASIDVGAIPFCNIENAREEEKEKNERSLDIWSRHTSHFFRKISFSLIRADGLSYRA